MKLFRIIIVLVLAGVACPSQAQIVTKMLGKEQQQFNVDSLIHDFDNRPFFGIYKDNYFALGTALNHKPNEFNNWFDALHYMENEIDKTDYDICIVGYGAYGILLAAHCKQMGKKAIHLGGATQLLFGIRGKRWEDPNYGFNGTNYLSFMTPYWVRPTDEETPRRSSDIENGCYW